MTDVCKSLGPLDVGDTKRQRKMAESEASSIPPEVLEIYTAMHPGACERVTVQPSIIRIDRGRIDRSLLRVKDKFPTTLLKTRITKREAYACHRALLNIQGLPKAGIT